MSFSRIFICFFSLVSFSVRFLCRSLFRFLSPLSPAALFCLFFCCSLSVFFLCSLFLRFLTLFSLYVSLSFLSVQIVLGVFICKIIVHEDDCFVIWRRMFRRIMMHASFIYSNWLASKLGFNGPKLSQQRAGNVNSNAAPNARTAFSCLNVDLICDKHVLLTCS